MNWSRCKDGSDVVNTLHLPIVDLSGRSFFIKLASERNQQYGSNFELHAQDDHDDTVLRIPVSMNLSNPRKFSCAQLVGKRGHCFVSVHLKRPIFRLH